MRDLKTTKDIVQYILEHDEKARNSDNHLYLQVLRVINVNRYDIEPINFVSVVSFFETLNKADCPYPGFETVRRARQKAQAENPNLAASERVREYRAENETAFREFARG